MTKMIFSPVVAAELKVVSVNLSEMLSRVVEKFGHVDALLNALEESKSFKTRLETVIELAIKQTFTLIHCGQLSFMLTVNHEPSAFFRNRPAFLVNEKFRELIVRNAKPTNAGTSSKFNVDASVVELTDGAIEEHFSYDHLFDESSVSAIIFGILLRRPIDAVYAQLNIDDNCLFYTETCVVCVYKDDQGRRRVNAYDRDDAAKWPVGTLVFSPLP